MNRGRVEAAKSQIQVSNTRINANTANNYYDNDDDYYYNEYGNNNGEGSTYGGDDGYNDGYNDSYNYAGDYENGYHNEQYEENVAYKKTEWSKYRPDCDDEGSDADEYDGYNNNEGNNATIPNPVVDIDSKGREYALLLPKPQRRGYKRGKEGGKESGGRTKRVKKKGKVAHNPMHNNGFGADIQLDDGENKTTNSMAHYLAKNPSSSASATPSYESLLSSESTKQLSSLSNPSSTEPPSINLYSKSTSSSSASSSSSLPMSSSSLFGSKSDAGIKPKVQSNPWGKYKNDDSSESDGGDDVM